MHDRLDMPTHRRAALARVAEVQFVQPAIAQRRAIQEERAGRRGHLAELFEVEAAVAEVFIEVPFDAAMHSPRLADERLVA